MTAPPARRGRQNGPDRPDAVIAHTLLDEADLILNDLSVLADEFHNILRRSALDQRGGR